jgi:transcriptional regulator with XRE-family HTH domain
MNMANEHARMQSYGSVDLRFGSLLGKAIRDIRKLKGISLKEASELCKVSTTHLSLLERGKTTFTFQLMDKLVLGLGVAPSWVLVYAIQTNEIELDELVQDLRAQVRTRINKQHTLAIRELFKPIGPVL